MTTGSAATGVAAERVVRLLADHGETLAVAESLTGGLLAATIVDVPGASAVFRGGLVVYATALKESLAGVPGPLLAERGPVDPDVAQALAAGARDRCGADWGLATTGVAGPEPQDGVAVGTVYVACAGPGLAQVRRLRLDGHAACAGPSVAQARRPRLDGHAAAAAAAFRPTPEPAGSSAARSADLRSGQGRAVRAAVRNATVSAALELLAELVPLGRGAASSSDR